MFDVFVSVFCILGVIALICSLLLSVCLFIMLFRGSDK